MIKLVLVRHGESVWNKENKFTGWTDVELSSKGVEEARNAGLLLKNNNYYFDIAYTSYLKRAQDTLSYILDVINETPLIYKSWKLNERHYGALQGYNKKEMADKFGEDKVHFWRRGYDVKVPELEESDIRYPGNDSLYQDVDKSLLPLSESLKDTYKRVVEYFNDEIRPNLLANKSVIIVAHGNSLRSLVKYLDNISDDDIVNVEIPTGVPLIYELDDELKVIKHYYLDKG